MAVVTRSRTYHATDDDAVTVQADAGGAMGTREAQDALWMVDYEEAMQQVRLCMEAGMSGPKAIEKAVDAAVYTAVVRA